MSHYQFIFNYYTYRRELTLLYLILYLLTEAEPYKVELTIEEINDVPVEFHPHLEDSTSDLYQEYEDLLCKDVS